MRKVSVLVLMRRSELYRRCCMPCPDLLLSTVDGEVSVRSYNPFEADLPTLLFGHEAPK